MTDRTREFDLRLERVLRTDAERAVRPFDAVAIATGAIRDRAPRTHRFVFGFALSPVGWIGLVLMLIALLLGAVLMAGAILRNRTARLPAGNGAIIVPLVSTAGDNRVVLRVLAADGSSHDLDLPVHSRSCPTYSPDGRSLAYLARSTPDTPLSEQLVVSGADGTGPRVLWAGRFNDQTLHQVVWSLDGRYVAASEATSDPYPNTGNTLVVGHADGSPATVLDWNIGEDPASLAWSPDGRSIAAVVWINDSTYGIEVRDLDGGPGRTIVTAPSIRDLAWSPDGRTIAYTAANTADPAAARDLYFVNADGSDPVVIQPNSPGSESFLAWSRDGRYLAVLVYDDDTSDRGTFSTRVLDRSGTDIRQLGPFPVSGNLSFTWSPDGRSLLYSTGVQDATKPGPMIVPIDGGARRVLDVPADEFYTQCPLSWQAVEP